MNSKQMQDRIAQLEEQLEAANRRIAELEQGRKWTPEQRAKLSASMQQKAHKWTEEEKAKMSQTMKEKAHKWTPEEKAKMSERMTAAFALIKQLEEGSK